MLNAWRVAGRLPYLDSDAIADTLKSLPLPHEQPEYLRPSALKQLLQAALRHDQDVFAETREEHAGFRPKGTTHRYVPITPFVLFVLLSGCRRSEALQVQWQHVDLDAFDTRGCKVGEIRLPAEITKTKRARTIGLEVSPALHRLLSALKLQAGPVAPTARVFGGTTPYTENLLKSSRNRLLREYGAPAFDWQNLRATCGTYLTNAPGIFGSGSVFLSARQLGHSVAVAEKHYLGVHRGIPASATTLEAAMEIMETVVQAPTPSSGIFAGKRDLLLLGAG